MNSSTTGIWAIESNGEPSLIGSQCRECGKASFPAKEVCPYCMTNESSSKIFIGKVGKIVSFTICYTAPKGIQAPYSLGVIEIENGVQVLAQISGESIHVGDDVQLVVYSVRLEDNEEVTYWKYQVMEGGMQ